MTHYQTEPGALKVRIGHNIWTWCSTWVLPGLKIQNLCGLRRNILAHNGLYHLYLHPIWQSCVFHRGQMKTWINDWLQYTSTGIYSVPPRIWQSYSNNDIANVKGNEMELPLIEWTEPMYHFDDRLLCQLIKLYYHFRFN